MAGDWIKIEHVTADKPEIYRIANLLNTTPEDALGRCIRVWIWADQQSLDGHRLAVTFVTVDSIARSDGFAKAMLDAGWLKVDDDGLITFPNFERHNGKTAKLRARNKKNQANLRNDDDDEPPNRVIDPSPSRGDIPVTREEKRREERKERTSNDVPKNGALFDAWYANYPRKVAKGAAKKAFERIIKARKATPEQLDAGLRRYVQTKPAAQDWCHPATWLNNERWLDQENAGGVRSNGGDLLSRYPNEGVPPKTGGYIRPMGPGGG